MLYAKLLRTFAGAGADTPWSEGYYNHCDPVPVCKVRAGAAVVVLTPVLVRDTFFGGCLSICMCGGCCRGGDTCPGQGCIYISIYLIYISIQYLYSIYRGCCCGGGDTCPGQGRCSPHLPHTTEGEGGGRLEGGGGEMVGSQETQAQPAAHVSLG